MKYLNEILINWADIENDQEGILNQNDIKKSFEKIDLNSYEKSMTDWLIDNRYTMRPYQDPDVRPWIINYINDILNLYFYNKKYNFEEFIQHCIKNWEAARWEAGNDWLYSKQQMKEILTHEIVTNFSQFGGKDFDENKLFKVPKNSELEEIVDIRDYVPAASNQITFWNFTIFGMNGIIFWLVKNNTPFNSNLK